jgi:hypothetical protein
VGVIRATAALAGHGDGRLEAAEALADSLADRLLAAGAADLLREAEAAA